MEVLGGNGYTEELPLARMLREMPVNSIWEGSGNIMCLDVLRAFDKAPGTREAVLRELSAARGLNDHYDAAFVRFAALLQRRAPEAQARRFTQSFVTLIQAALLLAPADSAQPGASAVAEGFCATRLSSSAGWGAVFGAGALGVDARAIMDRAWME
jgi:putative acyl-CoA dehydrogenase